MVRGLSLFLVAVHPSVIVITSVTFVFLSKIQVGQVTISSLSLSPF